MSYKFSTARNTINSQPRGAIYKKRNPAMSSAGRLHRNWRFLIISAFLVYLLGLTLKPVVGEEAFVHTSEIINSIRTLSPYFYAYGILVMAAYVFRAGQAQRPSLSPAVALFLLSFLYYDIRLSFDGDIDIAKLAGSFFGQIVLTLFIAFYFSLGKDIITKIDNFIFALRIWAVIYTLLTFANLMAGYGYETKLPRYYGVTSHPNFAGVGLAVASIVLLDLSVRRKLIKSYFFASFSLFSMASYLMFLTASRTAFMMYVVFLAIYCYLKYGISARLRFSLLIEGILVAIVLLFFWNSNFFIENDVIERIHSAGNDRSSAWSVMIDAIIDNFVFGAGHKMSASESSYLKAMGSTGVIFGSIYMASILYTIYSVSKVLFFPRSFPVKFPSMPLFVAALIGLLLGAIFEGYLIELASPWVFLYLIGTQIVFCIHKERRHFSYPKHDSSKS